MNEPISTYYCGMCGQNSTFTPSELEVMTEPIYCPHCLDRSNGVLKCRLAKTKQTQE